MRRSARAARGATLAFALLAAHAAHAALGPATAHAAPRHAVCADLGPTLGFGVSSFSSAGDWAVRAHDTGVEWRFLYLYLVPTDDPPEAVRDWLRGKVALARSLGAIPVLTFYQLLELGRRAGLTGSEPEIVGAALRSPETMARYYASLVTVLESVAELEPPVLLHSEPDSWGFMIWAMGVEGNDDPTSVPVSVAASGLADLADLPDDAGGFGRALLRLRDLHAPAVRMGWHASNFRVGTRPEVTAAFYAGVGEWDVLVGEAPHLEADPTRWWEPWDEARLEQNLGWLSAVTRSAGVPLLLWQMPIGTTDWHLLGAGDDRTLLARFAAAGVGGVLFEHQGSGDPDGFRAFESRELATVPPAGSGAGGTAADLRARLVRYAAAPLAWPEGSPCRGASGPTDAGPTGGGDASTPPATDAGPTGGPDGAAPGEAGPRADAGGGSGGDGGCGCRTTGTSGGSLRTAWLALLGLAALRVARRRGPGRVLRRPAR